MAKKKAKKESAPKVESKLPIALSVGDELSNDGLSFEVTQVEDATEWERRYRVREVGNGSAEHWLKHRCVGDIVSGFQHESEELEQVHEGGTFHLLPRVVAHFTQEEGDFLILERAFGKRLTLDSDCLVDANQRSLIFEQILLAVSKLHRGGYIVTDLRPESFDVDEQGGLQLVELSALTPRHQVPAGSRDDPFRPPEMKAGELVDERSDIFSVGALFAAASLGEVVEEPMEWFGRAELAFPAEPVITQMLRGALTEHELRFLSVDEMRILLYQLKNEQARFPRPAAAISSTVGISRFRYINEDSAGYQELSVQYQSRPQHVGFYSVADGMGGHELGERASQLAILGALQAFRQLTQEIPFERLHEELPPYALAIGRAASEIVTSGAAQFPGGARMGTTFTGVLVLNDDLALVHVGDSRAVLIRDGLLEPLTLDHSLVASLVRVGQMTEEEAAESDERNVLVRCIDARLPLDESGFDSLAAIGFEDGRLSLLAGDIVVILSDGVWGAVSDEQMLEIATSHEGAQTIGDAIVRAALDNGSDDNATVLAIVWS